MEDRLLKSIEKLGAEDVGTVLSGLKELETQMDALDDETFAQTVDALAGLFYLDPYDRPDLKPVIDLAADVLVKHGDRSLDILVEMMPDADMKFAFNAARAVGRMGSEAFEKLVQTYELTDNTAARSIIVYAIGKIKDPLVARAIPLLLQAVGDSSREVRDSAVRALGKVVEMVPAENIDAHERGHIVEALEKSMGDRFPGVRAKALRSLGKMAGAGYLSEEQKERLADRSRSALGQGEKFTWDNANIVRKEAEFALRQLGIE
jgi:HEAT repeat protein